MTDLPDDVRDALDHIARFDGHNGFKGAGGKENAIRGLRQIHAAHGAGVDAAAIEAYLSDHPKVYRKGAQLARRWYEDIARGVRHRGPGGNSIT